MTEKGCEPRRLYQYSLLLRTKYEEQRSESAFDEPRSKRDARKRSFFFHTLKSELVMHCDYKTRDDARVSLFDYMDVFTTGSGGTHRISYEAPLPFQAMKSPAKASTVRG